MIPNDEYVSKTDLLNWLEESKHDFDNVEDNEYAYKSLILRTFDCVNHWVGNMKAVRHCGMDWAYCEYQYGVIILNPFMKEDIDREIIGVFGSGGWSCSDFNIRVK